MDGVVAAGGVADGVRRPGIAGGRGQRVVAALAVRDSDRVDRRQVDDVEAELGQLGQLGLDSAQAAPRAREQLIPGAEAGAQPVDLDREGLIEGDPAVALLLVLDGERELLAQGDVVLGGLGHAGVGELLDRVLDEPAAGGVLGDRGGGLEQHAALGELAAEVVLVGVDLALQLVTPGPEHVGPGLDRVLPGAGPIHGELARPAHAAEVRVDPAQAHLAPLLLARAAIADDGADELVAVTEDIGLDVDDVPDAPFGGVAAGVDGRRRELDDDPARSLLCRVLRGGWRGRCRACLGV